MSFALLAALALPTRGDIFEWEWIDPNDHSLGKQESETLVPGGAGVDAEPGAYLRNRDLTMAYFLKADLIDADLRNAVLTNADITGAVLNGADFKNSTGLTATQFYSTTSYQTGDLTRVRLGWNDLAGWNFADKDLTAANFFACILRDSVFTNAVVSNTGFSSTTSRGFTAAQFYSTASYQNGDLSGIGLEGNDLTRWNFADKDLTDANFSASILQGTDFTNAAVSGASFSTTTWSLGFTAAQLYETASYQNGDLSGIGLENNDLTGWNFAGKNIANASVAAAKLTEVDFTDAIVEGADFRSTTTSGFTAAQLYSTASYQTGELTGVRLGSNDLTGWNFRSKSLMNARFEGAKLSDADFTGANLAAASFRGAMLSNTKFIDATVSNANFRGATSRGFTATQLYSTSSYQTGELTGIGFVGNDLTDWNFAGKNLTGAIFLDATLFETDFTNAIVDRADLCDTTVLGFTAAQLYSTATYLSKDLAGIRLSYNNLSGWNFTGTNLADTDFHLALLMDADLTGADSRGAFELIPSSTTITRNMIHPDGHIKDGLHLVAGESLRLWDYDGDTPIPIVIEDGMSLDPAATLRAVFDADAWGSTIAFEAGVDVMLDGTLLLEFADGVDLAAQLGRTIDLFDWEGVSPMGAFTVDSPFV